MKKTVKIFSVIFALLLVIGTLASCGKAANDLVCYDTAEESAVGYGYDGEVGMMAKEESVEPSNDNGETLSSDRKLVKTANLSVETKTFDEFLTSLEAKVTELKGYVETSDVSNSGYYGDSCRYANYTVRIPVEKLDEFISAVSESAKVTNKTVNVSDITSSYIDTESHIDALKAEQTALMNILKKAESVSDTIEVYTRLSEVNAEIDSYERTLKSYDNDISYSTVEMNISEVERITEDEQEGFFAETGRRLKENIYNIGKDLRSFAIWFLSSAPYIAIFAVIFVVAVVIIKKKIKKRKARKAKAEQ